MSTFSTPVLFLIFNRPEVTAKVFEEIRKIKPQYLFIAADGPRVNHIEDIELCNKCREIIEKVDWDCELKVLFRNKNLGCGIAPYEAVSWFFENVEQGIILEDDVFPDISFWEFCETMLNYHKDNEHIMHISGCYFLESIIGSDPMQSYYFTKHIHVWGWATWKRAWKCYDYNMKDWPSTKAKELINYYGDYSIFWKNIYHNIFHKKIITWDYQWMFAIYKNNGIAINPTSNLTQNLGFGINATHTTDASSIFTTVKLSSISFYNHPKIIEVNTKNDALYYSHFLDFDLQLEEAKRKTLWKLKNLLKKFKTKFQLYLE